MHRIMFLDMVLCIFYGIGNSDRIPYSIKASRACKDAHCGGMESCRLCDPPQAENPASQDSFLLVEIQKLGKKSMEISCVMYYNCPVKIVCIN